MFRFNFSNEVSPMDLVALGTAAAAVIALLTGVGSDIEGNTRSIEENSKAIERIEEQAEKSNEDILKRLSENADRLDKNRSESAAGRQRIEDKLDRLIERQLNEN